MYSTCLFCNHDLGRNEALYDFPVGRRLAFDGVRGRLWVVCRRCERWNLSPLEKRWEALEQAERQYRATKQRVATEQIGLARLADGTELVRIGSPLRPEFAAWRYGDQFGRRRRKRMLVAGSGLTAFGAVVAGGAMTGASVAAFMGIIVNGSGAIINGRPDEAVARVRTAATGPVEVRRRHLAETRFLPGTDGPLALDLRYKGGAVLIEGREAMVTAGRLMPHVNRYGGASRVVKSAVDALETAGGPDGYLKRLARIAPDATRVEFKSSGKRKAEQSGWTMAYTSGLFGLSGPDRLALEMALHEEAELRALRGELKALEHAWAEAEEIAAISDGMLTPTPVRNALDRIRRGLKRGDTET